MELYQGRSRVIIEHVYPEIDCGRFAIKRVPGESVTVEATIFGDGHDAVSAVLFYRDGDGEWCEAPMEPLFNDRWRGRFTVHEVGESCYTILAWADRFKSWSRDLVKRLDAGQDVSVDRVIGADLVEAAARQAPEPVVEMLRSYSVHLRDPEVDPILAMDPLLDELMFKHAERRFATRYEHELRVTVDPPRARFSTWYELFPRSCSPVEGKHGTFRDVAAMVPRIASMGFDVIYLPPIHPIGETFRKGPNNNPVSRPGDLGSPWAIGGREGGHKAIHPQLGTLEDFHALVEAARQHDISIALDLAYQCSPDHPYVRKHPEWFRQRPDGTIQYAENPPKKYQDIYPFDFESEDWEALWHELESVVRYWVEQGVHVFRVDNPHTKSFHFWEWMITRLKREYPDLIFLSEAFTRPSVMSYLAKLGFNQSYTYFTWRNTRWELMEYMTELTQTEVREYFRPNFWPNTPDILPEVLQLGGRPAFMQRLVLAATLAASYGIYGPAYELYENAPLEAGREEYLDSEKYVIRQRDLDQPGSLRDFITTVNRIRHENPALQTNEHLTFHHVDNEEIIAYSKHTPAMDNIVLTIVSMDPHHTQSGWLDLPLDQLGIEYHQPFLVEDVLNGHRYLWHGGRNYVELNPHTTPAHIFRIRRRLRTEEDFEYYM
jgi:starch synthase (maltosyl-transferring)